MIVGIASKKRKSKESSHTTCDAMHLSRRSCIATLRDQLISRCNLSSGNNISDAQRDGGSLMLAPLDRVQVHTLLHQLPQGAQFSQEVDSLSHGLEHIIDLLLRGEPSDTKANRAVGALVGVTQSTQHVAGLEGRGCTSGSRGQGDVLERHEEGFALDVGEGDVHAAGVVSAGVAVLRGVFHGKEAVEEALRESGDVLGVILEKN